DAPQQRAELWRRRARLYRDSLGRDAEAYGCLKEAHACAPADPEIAYQLRTAAMVRGEWPLAASLLYREIAAATNPRDRGALHLELALIYEERLDDYVQAQANVHRTSGDLVALTGLTSVRASRAGMPDERATAWLEVARLAEELSSFDQAARAYDLALIEDPGHVSALDARGALAFRQSDFA